MTNAQTLPTRCEGAQKRNTDLHASFWVAYLSLPASPPDFSWTERRKPGPLRWGEGGQGPGSLQGGQCSWTLQPLCPFSSPGLASHHPHPHPHPPASAAFREPTLNRSQPAGTRAAADASGASIQILQAWGGTSPGNSSWHQRCTNDCASATTSSSHIAGSGAEGCVCVSCLAA